jgi:hypothetical protein
MRAEWSDCCRAAEQRDELTSPHDRSAKPNDVLKRSLARIDHRWTCDIAPCPAHIQFKASAWPLSQSDQQPDRRLLLALFVFTSA